MTLLICMVLLYHIDAPVWMYAVSVVVWGAHLIYPHLD